MKAVNVVRFINYAQESDLDTVAKAIEERRKELAEIVVKKGYVVRLRYPDGHQLQRLSGQDFLVVSAKSHSFEILMGGSSINVSIGRVEKVVSKGAGR